jgi:mannose-1-phosphate guanylyltransferase
MKRYAVIMAGGVGSRFWPSSTEAKPKQFLDILGKGQSLLQMTYERILPLIPKDQILIVTNKQYYNLVKEQLSELPEDNILCEPSRNNTAPCIAYAALHIKARINDASFAILASDHVIKDEEKFRSILNKAFETCEQNDIIVTLGITPTRPDTGYGYLQLGSTQQNGLRKVEEFKEKPSLETAIEYVESKNYAWNSGMFIWTVKTIIDSFNKYCPQIIEVLNQAPQLFNSPSEQEYIDEVYPHTENISVDYAIMEKADNIYNISADMGWSDLGTWASLYEYSDKDENNNLLHSDNAVVIEVGNSIIKTNPSKKIIIRGLENFIIVDDQDALLIFPKDKEQELKEALKSLK